MSDSTAPKNTETDTAEDQEAPKEDPIVAEGEAHLGDPGKQALDRMKQERNQYRDERNQLQTQIEELQAEAAKAPEIMKVAQQKILQSELKAAAAGKLHDPADAHRFINIEDFEVSEDGEVDAGKISAAVADLLDSRPYLGGTQRPNMYTGSGDQGVRKESVPAQLSREDLSRLTPLQVLEAEKKGLLQDIKQGN